MYLSPLFEGFSLGTLWALFFKTITIPDKPVYTFSERRMQITKLFWHAVLDQTFFLLKSANLMWSQFVSESNDILRPRVLSFLRKMLYVQQLISNLCVRYIRFCQLIPTLHNWQSYSLIVRPIED
jgi:hypothetical protein